MKPDMSVNIAGVILKNPVVTASGTCGYGREYAPYYSPAELGAITVKCITAKPRRGNPPPRVTETPGGMINAIGLQNPGADYFLKNELPALKQTGATVIVNIAGSTPDEYAEVAGMLEGSDADMIEMNISCPNVKEGGIAFGTRPDLAEAVTAAVRKRTSKPLIVKLSPNVSDITELARAAESGGADALSLINTLLGMRIDIKKRRPILANVTGGLSGPAIFPVALRMVWQTRAVTALPIIGGGGISSPSDAVEMLLAGADAVSVGTAQFSDPLAPVKIRDGIRAFCEENSVVSVSELKAVR
ncbi:MAG: dihydroorotate dehydrogenase [Firmicutes bacterium]|nr:dihydroorotate dehydrogenase [Bacillota bacterium]